VTGDPAVAFTSFGDHESPYRLAFPDLVGLTSSADFNERMPPSIRELLAAILRQGLGESQRSAGEIMVRLRDGPMSASALAANGEVLSLLTELAYVRQTGSVFHAAVPVFTRGKDMDLLARVRALGRESVRAWLGANYESVRDRLVTLRAVAAGVPYEIVFTQVWHDLFGWANYYLSLEGILCNPYGPDTAWEGYVPFVWEESLRLYEGTGIF
jgi:hypothetical protein